eukprot:TRINITY_DN17027_c0_g1_i1.p1 TRINITY_DN17027_c0_g1~~TRINITY_DN17027_c0_g1_i1.p1  ORF type:complete len:119 (-),score=9.48 TRINITY_DN17027_c0_g1_i1:58-363(-)
MCIRDRSKTGTLINCPTPLSLDSPYYMILEGENSNYRAANVELSETIWFYNSYLAQSEWSGIVFKRVSLRMIITFNSQIVSGGILGTETVTIDTSNTSLGP